MLGHYSEGLGLTTPNVLSWPKGKSLEVLRGLGKRNAGKTVILLQGPVGPFFADVARAAQSAGLQPVKINFNAADWMFSRSIQHINYTGAPNDWRDWFDHLVDFTRPAAILLMGDGRPLHRQAIEIANARGIEVVCFEEGYVRPDYITMESGGVNANSPIRAFAGDLARRPEFIEQAPAEHAAPHRYKGNSFWQMAGCAIRYFVMLNVGKPFFPKYQHHRRRPLWSEAILWTRAGLLKLLRRGENDRKIHKLVTEHKNGFFVVALQVGDDLQLTVHGRGWTNEQTLNRAISSFARFAAPTDRLVIKGHPQDRGHTLHKSYVRQIAQLAGCADRVDYIDDGSIALLLTSSKGLITINSTAGLSALHHHKPLLAFGDALYSAPDLAIDGSQGDALDRFWSEPMACEVTLAQAFISHLHDKALVNGSFYLRSARRSTAERVIARLQAMLSGEKQLKDAPEMTPAPGPEAKGRLEPESRRLGSGGSRG